MDRGDLGEPGHLDLGIGGGARLHDLGGPELVAAHDHRHLGREAREERGLLDGGVAATDHDDVLVAEEEAVARRAPGDTATGQPLLVLQAQLLVGGTGGQDDGARALDVALRRRDDLDVTFELHAHDVVVADLGAEALGLRAHVLHEVGAHDAVAEAREILYLGGVHQRATCGHAAGDHQGLEVGARGVDGRGVARGARADDDDVTNVS